MSLNISALPAKMRDFALSDEYQLLTRLLIAGMGFTDYFQTLAGVKDEIPLTELLVAELLQPGAKDTFDPKANALSFRARIGKVRPCKVDLRFTPTMINTIWKSYLGKVSAGNIDVYTLPFEAFLMQKVIERTKRDLRMAAVFGGVYNPAGTTAAATMDGIRTKIAADITGAIIPAGNVLTQVAYTPANAYDQLSGLADLVTADTEYGNADMVCIVSPQIKRFYNLDYQSTHGALPYNAAFDKQYIDGTNIEIMAEPAMTGSNRVIVTPKDNLFWLVDDEAKTDTLLVEYEKRNINVLMDFNAGVEYGIAELIWTNNQA